VIGFEWRWLYTAAPDQRCGHRANEKSSHAIPNLGEESRSYFLKDNGWEIDVSGDQSPGFPLALWSMISSPGDQLNNARPRGEVAGDVGRQSDN
jgi:hypothetical protein